MVWPFRYQRASHDFEAFMVAARDAADLATLSMAWGMVQGVFWAFRRRLTVAQTAAFSNVLPPVMRAVFLEDWDPDGPVVPFGTREEMTREVQQVRHAHNFAPAHSIAAVASALRGSVDAGRLDAVLATFPLEAQRFWSVGQDRSG